MKGNYIVARGSRRVLLNSDLKDSTESGPAIKIRVEAHDAADPVSLHDGDVERIAGRPMTRELQNLAGWASDASGCSNRQKSL